MNQAALHPGHDLAALENYAYEFLCQASTPARAPSSAARLRASAINPARLESPSPTDARRGPIPLGFEIWLDYLFQLDALLHYVRLSPRALSALELQGLQALARARARFLRSHAFCPHCEAANPHASVRCAHCHKEL